MEFNFILEDIISILKIDYAGCIDKQGNCEFDEYREKLTRMSFDNKLTPIEFYDFINDLLTEYKDSHLFFLLIDQDITKNIDIGFTVRRFEDKLYVVSASNEIPLEIGDAILAIEGLSIPEMAIRHKHLIECIGIGSERENWKNVLSKYSRCNIIRDNGQEIQFIINKYEKSNQLSKYTFTVIEKNIGLLTISDFFDTEKINKMLDDVQTEIGKCEDLIIDVRSNRGGSDSAFYKLLEYCFDGEIDIKELDNTPTQFNMTHRNYELRISALHKQYENAKDEISREFLMAFIQKLEEHKNQGLVIVDLFEAMPSIKIKGNGVFSRVVVLSDSYCASSGDAFIEIVKKSPKVTVIGRATAGITDYSNLAAQYYGDQYILKYPTSRNALIDQGKGINGKGIEPHIYIPWTPDHLKYDVDVKKAIEFLCKG